MRLVGLTRTSAALCIPALAALLATAPLGAAAAPGHGPVLGVETIGEQMPYYDPDRRRVVAPRPGDEFPPMRVLLSRERYWQQDGHMDIVVQLQLPEGVSLAGSRLRVRLADAGGRALSAFDIAPLPGERFVFYPKLPEGFVGAGAVELAWEHGGRTVAQDQRPFRVEAFDEQAGRSGRVRLSLPNPDGVSLSNVPVSVGVPFPRGALSDTNNLRLVSETGAEIPLQVKETARWSKFGPLKWVLCDFTADLAGEGRELFLEYGPDVRRAEREAMGVRTGDGFPEVDAGRLRLGGGLWFDAAGDGVFVKVLDERALSGAFVEHEDGRVYRAPLLDEFAIEEAGAEKVVVRREGWYVHEEEGRQFCKYVTRYMIYRDSPVVRIFHSWVFTGDGNADRIRNMGWEFAMADGFGGEGFLTAFGEEGRWARGDFLVQWDYDHFDLMADGHLEEHGEARAPGAAAAAGAGVRMHFGAKDFWQNYPSELEFRGGSLFFHNWPRHNRPAGYTFEGELEVIYPSNECEPALPSAARHQHYEPGRLTNSEWRLNAIQQRFAHEGEVLDFRLPDEFGEDPFPLQAFRLTRTRSGERHWEPGNVEAANAQGISRTEEMWLYLEPADGEGGNALRVLEGLNEERLRAEVDPVWMMASGAFYELHHQDFANFPEEERAFELVALSPRRIAEQFGAYGMWIYGDLPVWFHHLPSRNVGLYRAYRKAHHGWPYSWKPFARSGDSRLFKIAEASTRQMIDANYCHYYDEKVDALLGTGRTRQKGRWRRSAVPWAGYHRPVTQNYESQCDFLWHAYYLTGYARAKDNVLCFAEQTKKGELTHRIGLRHCVTLLKSYLEMYEATFDPWFLVAAHAIAEGHYDIHRRDGWAGHPWDTSEREFLRYTGREDYREWYLHHAGKMACKFDALSNVWIRATSNMLSRAAYAWNLSGEEYFLRRAAGYLNLATGLIHDGAEPDYYQGYVRRGGGTAYGLFTSWHLRQFPAALWALSRAGERPSPIRRDFTFRLPESGGEGGASHSIAAALAKQPGEALAISLRSRPLGRIDRAPASPGLEAAYEVLGPDGAAVLAGSWRVGDDLTVEVPADAPAGIYRLSMTCASADAPVLVLPVTEVDVPEVVELGGGAAEWAVNEGAFWFMVPEGVEAFSVEFPEYVGASIWNPDGGRAWNQADHYGDEARWGQATVEVDAAHSGCLWRVELPGGGFRMDERIPPYFATDPARWFAP